MQYPMKADPNTPNIQSAAILLLSIVYISPKRQALVTRSPHVYEVGVSPRPFPPTWKMEGNEDPVYLVNGDGTTTDSQSDDESSQDEDEEREGEDYVLLPQDPSDEEECGVTRTLNGEGEFTLEEHNITSTSEPSTIGQDPPESVALSVQVQESHKSSWIENKLPKSSAEPLGGVERTQSDSTAGDMMLDTSGSQLPSMSAASSTNRDDQMQDGTFRHGARSFRARVK